MKRRIKKHMGLLDAHAGMQAANALFELIEQPLRLQRQSVA
jgi:hypothetical protein